MKIPYPELGISEEDYKAVTEEIEEPIISYNWDTFYEAMEAVDDFIETIKDLKKLEMPVDKAFLNEILKLKLDLVSICVGNKTYPMVTIRRNDNEHYE